MPEAKTHTRQSSLRVLVMIACIIIIIAGLRTAKDLLLPLVLASFIAIASYPITLILREKCRFPHWLAVCFTVAVDFSFLVGIGFLTNYLAKNLITIWNTKYYELILQKINEFESFLVDHNLEDKARELFYSLNSAFTGSHIFSTTTLIMGKAASMLTVITLILILMTFFLSEAPCFGANAKRVAVKHGDGIHQFVKALSGVQKYLVIKTIISLTTGLLAWWLCAAVGIDLPLLWGILAFVLNFIPTFGSIAASIPPILLAFLTLGTTEAVIVAAGYLTINTALGNILDPLLMGKQFGIVTSVVLLSVVFWGWIWGPIGMLLAVPITMLIKLALENSQELSWIAMLIEEPPKQSKIPLPGLPVPTVEDELCPDEDDKKPS